MSLRIVLAASCGLAVACAPATPSGSTAPTAADAYARAVQDARKGHSGRPPLPRPSASGEVEVLLYSPAVPDHGIRSGNDAERHDLIRRAFPDSAFACGPTTADVPHTETRGLASGPFSAPGRDERLGLFLTYPPCGHGRPPPGTQQLVLFDARGQVIMRKPVGDQQMLYAADDFFGEGRQSFVLVEVLGRNPTEHMVARLTRFEGGQLVVLAQSLPMSLVCENRAEAPAFVAVLHPGGAREYRTVRPEGTCPR